MTKRQIEAAEKREAQIVTASNHTDYSAGVIGGHYVGKRTAGYLKKHTRCTKGHGWTKRGEFGGCAICEQEGE